MSFISVGGCCDLWSGQRNGVMKDEEYSQGLFQGNKDKPFKGKRDKRSVSSFLFYRNARIDRGKRKCKLPEGIYDGFYWNSPAHGVVLSGYFVSKSRA